MLFWHMTRLANGGGGGAIAVLPAGANILVLCHARTHEQAINLSIYIYSHVPFADKQKLLFTFREIET